MVCSKLFMWVLHSYDLINNCLIFVNTGCKDFGIPEYKFIVIHGEGIGGLPAAGTYSYKELASINYDYIFIDDPERYPGVFVNDVSASYASAGTIIMYRDIEIFVGDVDIQGSWDLIFTDDNGNATESTIVFTSNAPLEGTFTDTRGYEGTWKNTSNKLFMSFTDWNGHIFEGGISPKYQTGNSFLNDNLNGSWTMVRQ